MEFFEIYMMLAVVGIFMERQSSNRELYERLNNIQEKVDDVAEATKE